MKLEIYRGSTQSGLEHVGVIDADSDKVICICGPDGDPDSEYAAIRIKAMFEFCEPLTVELMEQAAEARACRGFENHINARTST